MKKRERILPLLSIQFLFHLECDVDACRCIGPSPHGDRGTLVFKDGRFDGPKFQREIVPGGRGSISSAPFGMTK